MNKLKLRFHFTIASKEKALAVYDEITSKKSPFHTKEYTCTIFYLKPEDVFVKYADIEAQKWYKEQEEQKI